MHYCVTNMPGAVGRTSTQALCHATQPYVVKLASAAEQGSSGIDALIAGDPSFASALNLRDGKIVHPAVAAAMA